jgi:hypothetical protein
MKTHILFFSILVFFLGEISGFCALCSIQRHVTKVFCSEKSFKRGAALLPRPFTSNLRRKFALLKRRIKKYTGKDYF